MEIDLEGIVVIVGNYGSGKTEVAINLAVDAKRRGLDVRVADLDLVNPYFRTREARNSLAGLGIDLILPPKRFLQADLPVLSPKVAGAIRAPGPLTILDVGGDHVGAKVLAALADSLAGKRVEMLQVINPFRPFTQSIEGCLKLMAEIESAAGMKTTGLVGNAHLQDDTIATHILDGHEFVSGLAAETGLPVKFVTVPAAMAADERWTALGCPVLYIRRQLTPPWLKPADLDIS